MKVNVNGELAASGLAVFVGYTNLLGMLFPQAVHQFLLVLGLLGLIKYGLDKFL